jgi:hypothetical protein
MKLLSRLVGAAMDVGGRGNYILVIPYLLFVVAGVVVIMFAMRDRKRPPSIPNLMARRKHPLRHLQVEVNRARKEAKKRVAKLSDEEEKPERRRGDHKGPADFGASGET